MKSLRIFCHFTVLSLISYGFLPSIQAQIIPDRSLGSENSVVTPNVIIKGIPSDRIDGGARRGNNLFHSFQEFNVGESRGAYFSNPGEIANIFSRVTGGNISQIMGTLGVSGNTNLYFLNPNGILFGPNARLDLRGSFLATTADSFQFPNGYGFSASNPMAPPLLTVNIPIGLNFRTNSTATITNQGDLRAGQDLTLAGENLNLQGQLQARENLSLMAQNTVKIRDSKTNPFIAAAGENLTIQGNQAVDIFALNHPHSGLFSGKNMTLKSPEKIGGDAHFWSGGNFRIEQLDGNLGKLYSPNDPVIRTTGDVLIGAYEGSSLHIIAGGKVNIPNYVLITGADPDYGLQEIVTLADGTTVNVDGKNQPTLDIRAGVMPEWVGEPFYQDRGDNLFFKPLNFANSATSAGINIGTIIFRDGNFTPITGNILLTNQYFPNPHLTGSITSQPTLTNLGLGAMETFGPIGGGNIILSSRQDINLSGIVNASSTLGGGNIQAIAARNINLNNARLSVVGNEGGNLSLWGKMQALVIVNCSLVLVITWVLLKLKPVILR